MVASKRKAHFVEPMLVLRTDALPDDAERWEYQLKYDGYRAIAFKTGGQIHLRSRNDNDFSLRYPAIAKALSELANETAIDGELVALDESGKPSFNTLQNHGSAPNTSLFYYVFDVPILAGKDVMQEPLKARRELLEKRVLRKLGEPIRYSPRLPGGLSDLVAAVKAQGLEGLVAKRSDSCYEPGLRSGLWQKMRINQGAGTRHRRLHGRLTWIRCARSRLLRGRKAALCVAYSQRVHSGYSGAVIQETETA